MNTFKQQLENKRLASGKKKNARVEFLLQVSNIGDALKAGYKKVDIWKHLYEEKLFSSSYSQFLRYCKTSLGEITRHLDKKPLASKKEPKRLDTTQKRTFHFDPTADKRYLLERATHD